MSVKKLIYKFHRHIGSVRQLGSLPVLDTGNVGSNPARPIWARGVARITHFASNEDTVSSNLTVLVFNGGSGVIGCIEVCEAFGVGFKPRLSPCVRS